MGMDTSCGICGKHYQECSHYIKQHFPGKKKRTLCGRRYRKGLFVEEPDENTDPEDFCKTCLNIRGPVSCEMCGEYLEPERAKDSDICKECDYQICESCGEPTWDEGEVCDKCQDEEER